jgi:phosphoglycerate dehydrogenase-like enzyme
MWSVKGRPILLHSTCWLMLFDMCAWEVITFTLQVVGLGKSGRAAVRLALARGASVLAIDQNENLGLLEVNPCLLKYVL